MAGKKIETFEQKIGRLNEISNTLERGDETLEEMLKHFEEGIRVYRECFELLKDTETRIKMILEDDYAIKEVDIMESRKS